MMNLITALRREVSLSSFTDAAVSEQRELIRTQSVNLVLAYSLRFIFRVVYLIGSEIRIQH